MKTIIHNSRSLDVCIYYNDGEPIKGSFFNEKPNTGDIINSWEREFSVIDITANGDTKTTKSFKRNNKNAYFELKVERIIS